MSNEQKDVSVTSNGSADQNDSTCVRLSVRLQNSNIQSVTSVVLQSVSEKAENLLKCEGAIRESYESHTSTRPHFVQIANNGKVVCDDCPAYKSAKLCAHAVAAAEKAGILKEYVSWLNKSEPLAMNVTSFVTFDSAKGTRKKGRKSSTADTYVDRPLRGAVGSTVNTTSTVTCTSTQSSGSVQQSVCVHPQTQPVPPLVHACTSQRATTPIQPSPMQPSQMQQSPMQPCRMQPSMMQHLLCSHFWCNHPRCSQSYFNKTFPPLQHQYRELSNFAFYSIAKLWNLDTAFQIHHMTWQLFQGCSGSLHFQVVGKEWAERGMFIFTCTPTAFVQSSHSFNRIWLLFHGG